jgi:hypothetical protein
MFEISSVILIEAFESVVKIYWWVECGGESEGDSAWRVGRVIDIIFVGRAYIIVSKVHFLGG